MQNHPKKLSQHDTKKMFRERGKHRKEWNLYRVGIIFSVSLYVQIRFAAPWSYAGCETLLGFKLQETC